MDSKRLKIYKRTRVSASNDTREMHREDGEEMITNTSVDGRNRHVRTQVKNTGRLQTPQRTGRDSARTRRFRAATVCLALMCVFLLTAVIKLGVDLHQMIEKFYIKNQNLIHEIEKLNAEKHILQYNITILSQLNDTLITGNQRVQKKMAELWQQIRQMDGWKCYQSSLYFVSSEKKSWNESRRDCQERGADLIIINNRMEQEFLKTATGDSDVWIGLTDHVTEGTWKWVDDSALNSGFWATGKPSGGSADVDCAINLSTGFADYSCDNIFKWVCERKTK